jgi:lysozyme
MNLSANGLNHIKQWEAFRSRPYNDGYGNMTIGYGHVIKPGESFTEISHDQALQILAQDVSWAVNAVNSYVQVPLTQNQFDALVSLVFNWGAGNFANSILLQKLNAGDYQGAAQRLGEHPVTSGGVFSQGLANRRASEKALFLSGTNQNQGQTPNAGDLPTDPGIGFSASPESILKNPLVWLGAGLLLYLAISD